MSNRASPTGHEHDSKGFGGESTSGVRKVKVEPNEIEGSSAQLNVSAPFNAPETAASVPKGGNRPPSVNSVHSSASNGAPRTTTTSRRGGRTRSRSPPTLINRSSPTGSDRGFPGRNMSLGSSPASPGPEPLSNMPYSASNPSSAAAAAAAAAKALSKQSGNPSSIKHPKPEGGHRSELGRDEMTKFPSYDKHYSGSRNWPVDTSDPKDDPGPYSHSQSIHRPRRSDKYDRPSYSSRSSDHYRSRGNHHPPYDDHMNERRYGESRRGRERERGFDPEGRKSGHHGHYREAQYRDERGRAFDGRSHAKGQRSSGGGMSRVIGTATPIHVPRASDTSGSSRQSRVGTPASVFRGRPGVGDAPREPQNPEKGEDSPQKILLSLRTPTTSFDEKPEKNREKTSELPPSPEEPPQIQHSHHQHSSEQSLFFEPHRSPKNSGSIEMAPSFSLFNQSFDSFGDTFNVVGNLESNLQSASFGAGPSGSGDNYSGGQPIQRNISGGNYTQLLAGSGSGALTFGMSPVNSFGNGASSMSSRRNNMMVLGGQDHRSASPTQVLGMYQSYSGGAGAGGSSGSNGHGRPDLGPLEDSHLRLSGGSFGAQSLNHTYTRSFGAENSPLMTYGSRIGNGHSQDMTDGGGPIFYTLLRKYRTAFKECSFLLPGLKAALLEASLSDPEKDESRGAPGSSEHIGPLARGGTFLDPSPQEIAVAQLRVASSVCAFGGSVSGDRSSQSQESSSSNKGQSIFRDKDDGQLTASTATVTPSSSTGTPPGSRLQSRAKMKYDEVLPSRYYENENRLSWEFEESPPVDSPSQDDPEPQTSKVNGEDSNSKEKEDGSSKDPLTGKSKKVKLEPENSPKATSGESAKRATAMSSPAGGDQPKMRYRCKLCGQPKQNHTCPFMQSLARSIGVMVYPAVNAFTASEPGAVAPPLSEMNNFVATDDQSIASSSKNSLSHPTPDRMRRSSHTGASTQVTPDSRRAKPRHINSPSSLSTGSGTPQRPRTPASGRSSGMRGQPPASGGMGFRTPGSSRRSRKRRHGSEDQGDLLFVETTELRQEQFRLVTPSKALSSPDAYTYPALPLPYAQRKRLSDNLFSLSKKVPQLTDECAAVLREAREKDLWDLAVAELMTQVIVIIHCPDGDARFEGLRQYLLTLGIAC